MTVTQEELDAQPPALKELRQHNQDVDHDSVIMDLKPTHQQRQRQRAYYLAGAYMCNSIEEQFGRDYLSELVSKGSRQFIKEYNGIAPPDLKIDMLDFEA